MNRRSFLALGALGSVSPALVLGGCTHREDTPLAHLYGQDWVHGAYGLYAQKYQSIQTSSESSAQDAYALLAQKGIVALDGLQSREVPFTIRVSDDESGFSIDRDVPERLTLTADMTQADRDAAQASWEKARDSIQTDYEQIRRLNWALTTLLQQLQRIRSAIDHGTIEQYRIVRQVAALQHGDAPPFDLPYQVSVPDYQKVLYLLLERLDDDSTRLSRVESDIVTVGLTARATDAGSGSLAANLHKVLLAVMTDATATSPRDANYPAGDDQARSLARGQALFTTLSQSAGYIAWEKEESQKAFAQIGAILNVLDQVTGLHTSVIYQQALALWRGDADYLGYLKRLAMMFPAGREVVKVAEEAIALTEKVRKVAGQVQAAVQTGQQVIAQAKNAKDKASAIATSIADRGLVQIGQDSGLINAGSNFAKKRIEKQLSFLKDANELDRVKSLIAQSPLATRVLPQLGM